jgi:hypothetical protein
MRCHFFPVASGSSTTLELIDSTSNTILLLHKETTHLIYWMFKLILQQLYRCFNRPFILYSNKWALMKFQSHTGKILQQSLTSTQGVHFWRWAREGISNSRRKRSSFMELIKPCLQYAIKIPSLTFISCWRNYTQWIVECSLVQACILLLLI